MPPTAAFIRVEQNIKRLCWVESNRPVQGIHRFDRFEFDDLGRLGHSGPVSCARGHGHEFAHMGEGHVSSVQRVQHRLPCETQGVRQSNFEIAA